jgi:hypothetical protein
MPALWEPQPLSEEAVQTYIVERGSVSFAELQTHFTDTTGDHMMCDGQYPTLVYWAGCSTTLITVLQQLLAAKRIVMRPTSLLIYLVDGCCLKMPIAKRLRAYKKEHWLPVVFDPVKKAA